MLESKIRQLLELIEDYANEDNSWHEKRERLLQYATGSERTAIDEFVSWFEPETNQ